MENLYYSKVRDVKSPTRGTSVAAGIDFYVPKFNNQFIEDLSKKNPNISSILPGSYTYFILEDKILLGAHERMLIPSGLKIKGHPNVALNTHNKSGVASKKGLDRLAEVVDEDYEGEIHISIVNTSNHIVEICEDEKLVQSLEVHVDYSMPVEIPIEQLFIGSQSERKEGGFGSTDNK